MARGLTLLPWGTAAFSLGFAWVLIRHAQRRHWAPHLVWWAVGVIVYGLGGFTEAWIGAFGNSPALTKFWYIVGALWGGYPLAQGTVYFLLPRTTADRLTRFTLPLVILFSIFVVLSPIRSEALLPNMPTGKVLQWTWVRFLTPFVNLYAVVFLVGGAAWSAWRAWKTGQGSSRAWGNVWIAVGALLPGIGGGFAKVGQVHVLYLLEFTGILLIGLGYGLTRKDSP